MRQKLECLGIIVDTDQLLVNARKNNKSTGGLDEEFRTIKRSYHRECLKKHPDKGGSEAEFVRLNDVWENVREMYERKTIESYWEEAQKHHERVVKGGGGRRRGRRRRRRRKRRRRRRRRKETHKRKRRQGGRTGRISFAGRAA